MRTIAITRMTQDDGKPSIRFDSNRMSVVLTWNSRAELQAWASENSRFGVEEYLSHLLRGIKALDPDFCVRPAAQDKAIYEGTSWDVAEPEVTRAS